MAYHYHPGQRIRFIGRSEPGKKVQTGDTGLFASYQMDPMLQKLEEAAKLMGIVPPPHPAVVETKYFNEDGTAFSWYCGVNEIEPVFDAHTPAQWTEEDLKWLPDTLKTETQS